MTASARLMRMAAEIHELKAASGGHLDHDVPMPQESASSKHAGTSRDYAEDDFSDIFGEDDEPLKELRSSLN